MFAAILEFATALANAGEKVAKLNLERRVSLATFIDKIADCLADMVANPDRNTFGMRCAELRSYADKSSDVFKGVLDEESATQLASLLHEAITGRVMLYTIFMLGSEGNAQQREAAIDPLLMALGHMRGTANILRAPIPLDSAVVVPAPTRSWILRIWRRITDPSERPKA